VEAAIKDGGDVQDGDDVEVNQLANDFSGIYTW